MAILLLEDKMITDFPELFDKIIKKIHPISIDNAWPPVLHMTMVKFNHEEFLDNEVVMVQIYEKYNKLIPTTIKRTDKPFIRIYRHHDKKHIS